MKTRKMFLLAVVWLLTTTATFAQKRELVGFEHVEYDSTNDYCWFHIGVDYPVSGDPQAMALLKDFVMEMIDLYKYFPEDEGPEPSGAHQLFCPKMEVNNIKDLKRYIKTYCDKGRKDVVKNMKKDDGRIALTRSIDISRDIQTPTSVVFKITYREGRGIDVFSAMVPYIIRKSDGLRLNQPFKEEAIPIIERMVWEHPEWYFYGDNNLDYVEEINSFKNGENNLFEQKGRIPLPKNGGWIEFDHVYMQYAVNELTFDWMTPQLRFRIKDVMPYLKEEVKELIVDRL